MSFRYLLASAGLAALAGCQSQITEPEPEGIAYRPLEAHHVEHDCPQASCAEVRVNALRFPDSPGLSERLRTELLSMASGITDGERPYPSDTWEHYAQAFFAQAKSTREAISELPAYQANLDAKVYAQHDDLLVIELNSYVYTGGAHGMPLTEFMVIDERLGRVVGLEDMLIAGREAAFRQALVRAHERWLQETGADAEFAENWPLSETRNVAPLKQAWVVKYNVYDIAPYAAGQPQLVIPNRELAGIAKPRYWGVH
ncbi:DUF3298 and DUF4163 domain-containing protein [Halomonas sp. WWR20]